jgi:hypothetical protein
VNLLDWLKAAARISLGPLPRLGGKRAPRPPKPSLLRYQPLFDSFRSVGDNCEFGMVQAFYFSRQIGLLKYARHSFDGLMWALQDQFDALSRGDSAIRLEADGPPTRKEYATVIDVYCMSFHTGALAPIDEAQFLLSEKRRIALLVRTFIEDLEAAEKIFVYKTNETLPRDKIEALHERMRRYGPVTLMWVTPAENRSTAGRVEWLGEGLMRGRITRFAPYTNANAYDRVGWRKLCMAALALRDRRNAP